MQSFCDLHAGLKSEAFALEAGVAQKIENRRDGLVIIARKRKLFGLKNIL